MPLKRNKNPRILTQTHNPQPSDLSPKTHPFSFHSIRSSETPSLKPRFESPSPSHLQFLLFLSPKLSFSLFPLPLMATEEPNNPPQPPSSIPQYSEVNGFSFLSSSNDGFRVSRENPARFRQGLLIFSCFVLDFRWLWRRSRLWTTRAAPTSPLSPSTSSRRTEICRRLTPPCWRTTSTRWNRAATSLWSRTTTWSPTLTRRRGGVAAVLPSPRFLFLQEPFSRRRGPGAVRQSPEIHLLRSLRRRRLPQEVESHADVLQRSPRWELRRPQRRRLGHRGPGGGRQRWSRRWFLLVVDLKLRVGFLGILALIYGFSSLAFQSFFFFVSVLSVVS